MTIISEMNPDGSVRGNLRANTAGFNLNREWQTPSMEKVPRSILRPVRVRLILRWLLIGWLSRRSGQLGRDVLVPIKATWAMIAKSEKQTWRLP